MGLFKQQFYSGVALISVMLILAIMVVFVSYMIENQHLVIRQTSILSNAEQGFLSNRKAEVWAISKLLKTVADPKKPVEYDADSITERWFTDKLEQKLTGSTIAANIRDLQGRINLNNLSHSQAAEWKRILSDLFVILNIDTQIVDAIKDWIDEDRSGRYEDAEYSLELPFNRTANQNMRSINELLLIKGVDGEIFKKLIEHVTVLPGNDVKINIHTASLEVLQALIPQGQSNGKADALHQELQTESYFTIEELIDKHEHYAGFQTFFGLNSQYFELETTVHFQDEKYIFLTGIQRERASDNKLKFRVIYRKRV